MKDKKGAEFSVGAIILMILGVIILVVLIFGVTVGFGSFKEMIGDSNNVDKVISDCRIACASNMEYDFCSKSRLLKVEGLPNGEKDVSETCSKYARNSKYIYLGVEDCKGLCEGELPSMPSPAPAIPPQTDEEIIREFRNEIKRQTIQNINIIFEKSCTGDIPYGYGGVLRANACKNNEESVTVSLRYEGQDYLLESTVDSNNNQIYCCQIKLK